MSKFDFKLNFADTKRAHRQLRIVIRNYLDKILFSEHAQDELHKDGYSQMDAWNVLKSTSAKILRDGEFENGSYRYRLETNQIAIVFCFFSNGKGIIVITAWAQKKRRFR